MELNYDNGLRKIEGLAFIYLKQGNTFMNENLNVRV